MLKQESKEISAQQQSVNDKGANFEDITGLIVHAYNNFLSGMMGFTELALLDCPQQNLKAQLEASLESGNQGVHFGKQLLSSIGRLQVNLAPRNLIELLVQFANEKHIEFQNQIGEQSCLITTEAEWFNYCLNVLYEFCDNLSTEKTLAVKIILQDARAIVTFYSPSVDLTEVQQQQLFLPFYSSRYIQGTKDVGLAVVKGFLEQMNGEIEWQDKKGFIIKIPILER
ncbi:sensor histidine kinase [Aliikangiella maris]|uniref:Uncharacterized protein n=2 Tax=Aliikangiella maris TaxID=3162458 RepID=A0ABV3MJI4_9GAMM